MKNPIIVIALLGSTLAGVQAQVTGTGATATAKQPALPAPTAFSPVSRDGGSTVWERTLYSRGPNGTIVPRKSRYTELSSGLNFLDPTTKQWTPSREQIDLLPPGGAFAAAATHGPHSARFPLDIARGVIQLSGPDGKQLTSRPVALFLEDDSGSALIAVLTNSGGNWWDPMRWSIRTPLMAQQPQYDTPTRNLASNKTLSFKGNCRIRRRSD